MTSPEHRHLFQALRFALSALLLACLAPAAALAQFAPPAATPTPTETSASDPFGRQTPRGCLFGFFQSAERGNFQNAAEYLELPQSLRGSREAIARQIQIVFDHRFVTLNLDRLSRSSVGTLDDGLPPDQEKIGDVRGDDGMIDVILVREERSGQPVWLISWATVRELRQLYDALHLLDVDRLLPSFFVKTHVGAMALWQVLGIALLLPILFAISWIVVGLVLLLVRLLRGRRAPEGVVAWVAPARSPVTMLLALIAHRVAVNWLGMPVLYRLYYDRVIFVLLFVGLYWLLARLVDAVNRRYLGRVLPAGASARTPTLTLARRAMKLGAFVLVVLLALATFGVNLTATLAGLGIGGIALAFSAQKSLENIFGGLALLADKPASIGDMCKLGGQQGEIEDITLWATRIRTLDRTVLSIPNGAVMTGQIENLTRRDKFWFHPTVGLAYQTTSAQMRQVLEGVRQLLVADPRVETEGSRARFVRLGDSSLDVEVFAYVRVENHAEFLTVQEELLLRILELVEAAGTSIAYPSRTVFLRQEKVQ